ncbi:MAG TPA: hypothetical protein VD735_04275 [Candidatus Saccharimonadales bacterium]|nr:hypothetical protein [Candidatus Saccharimonadales bacterium]
MQVLPEQILPSQDFLKEKTVRFILECLRTGNLDDLPPTPLVRQDADGRLIAIDGHNLIAVRHYRNEPIEVIVATSSTDGLPATSEANVTRNQELADKFDTVLSEQRRVAAEGVTSFKTLIEKYPDLFKAAA